MRIFAAAAGIGQSDCERVVGATLAQPVLAITSLAYVAAGLAVLCWAVRARGALAVAAGWCSSPSARAASCTTGLSRHGQDSHTIGPSSLWRRCTPRVWHGPPAGSGGSG